MCDQPIGMGLIVSRQPIADCRELPQRVIHIARDAFADCLPGQFDGSRNSRMWRHARQPAQLIRAEAEYVVEPGIGTIEV